MADFRSHDNIDSVSERGEFVEQLSKYQLFKKDSAPCSKTNIYRMSSKIMYFTNTSSSALFPKATFRIPEHKHVIFTHCRIWFSVRTLLFSIVVSRH